MDYLRMNCGNCNGPIEFPSDAKGQESPCPHCGQKILLWADEAQSPPNFAPQLTQEYQIEKKTEMAGAGCLIQGVGVLVIIFGFWFIVPIFLGLGLIFWGGRMAIKYICPQCKNPLAGNDVRLCPVCKCALHK